LIQEFTELVWKTVGPEARDCIFRRFLVMNTSHDHGGNLHLDELFRLQTCYLFEYCEDALRFLDELNARELFWRNTLMNCLSIRDLLIAKPNLRANWVNWAFQMLRDDKRRNRDGDNRVFLNVLIEAMCMALDVPEIHDFSNSREFLEKLFELFSTADDVKVTKGLLKVLITRGDDFCRDMFNFLSERFPRSFALGVMGNR
jgi:hypothetical protein